VIPALGRLRQGDPEFEASLGFTARPYLKQTAHLIPRMHFSGISSIKKFSLPVKTK
jgi:hypothetical protein